MATAERPAPPPRPCPICGKPADERWKPFCSKRCADVDLHRWLGGNYRIETDDTPEDGSGPGGQDGED
jgi:endogenous inhibitor of DNA gyrase (YacG/DUF329 family)